MSENEPRTQKTLDQIVEILLDADAHGTTQAAKMHDITPATVRNFYKRLEVNPELAKMYVDAKRQVFSSMVSRISEAQRKILSKIIEKVDSGDLDVRELTAAYKIVADSFLAQSIMSGVTDVKDDGKQHHQSPHAESAKRAARETAERSPTILTSTSRLPQ